MAYGNWDDIQNELRLVPAAHTPWSKHAALLLELIPDLRQQSWMRDIIPVTSHLELQLRVPNAKTWVHVWGEEDGAFTVRLTDPVLGEAAEARVARQEVLKTIHQYLQKIPVPQAV